MKTVAEKYGALLERALPPVLLAVAIFQGCGALPTASGEDKVEGAPEPTQAEFSEEEKAARRARDERVRDHRGKAAPRSADEVEGQFSALRRLKLMARPESLTGRAAEYFATGAQSDTADGREREHHFSYFDGEKTVFEYTITTRGGRVKGCRGKHHEKVLDCDPSSSDLYSFAASLREEVDCGLKIGDQPAGARAILETLLTAAAGENRTHAIRITNAEGTHEIHWEAEVADDGTILRVSAASSVRANGTTGAGRETLKPATCDAVMVKSN